MTSPQADSRSGELLLLLLGRRSREGKRASMSRLREALAPRSVVGISRMRQGRLREVRISVWMVRRLSKRVVEDSDAVDDDGRSSDQPNNSTLVNSCTRYKPLVSTPRDPASAR